MNYDWYRGIVCCIAMAMVLIFPHFLHFTAGALLLHQTLFYFRRAFETMEKQEHESTYTVVELRHAGDELVSPRR